MSRIRENFGSLSLGVGVPTGFTALNEVDTTWEVVSDGTSEGGKALTVTKASGSRARLTLDSLDGATDQDVLIVFEVDATGHNVGIVLNSTGTAGAENEYLVRVSGASLTLFEASAGTYTSRSNSAAALPAVLTSGVLYAIRARRQGNFVAGRIWMPETEHEPALWDVSFTDTSPRSAGGAGIHNLTSTGTMTVHFLSAGLDNDCGCILPDSSLPSVGIYATSSQDGSLRVYDETDDDINAVVAIFGDATTANVRACAVHKANETVFVALRAASKVVRVDRYGLNNTTINSTVVAPYGLAVDETGGVLFITDRDAGKCYTDAIGGGSHVERLTIALASHVFWDSANSVLWMVANNIVYSCDSVFGSMVSYGTFTSPISVISNGTTITAADFDPAGTPDGLFTKAVASPGDAFSSVDNVFVYDQITLNAAGTLTFGGGATQDTIYKWSTYPPSAAVRSVFAPLTECRSVQWYEFAAPGGVTFGFASVDVTGFTLTVEESNSITSVTPTEAKVGVEVTINGTGFTGASSVTFGGVSATFTVDSPTSITATVPVGALTGNIVVTVGAETLTYSIFAVLPDVPADGYQIEIFQIRVNSGETDIEIVSGTYKQYYTEGFDDIDFIPVSFSNFERSVETEEGVYALGSVDLTVEGLPADYFNDYTEYINEPFVVVIRNAAGQVLFHGPIDPDTADYNAGTRNTAFRGLSWQVLLEAANSPCRYKYTTSFTRAYSDAWVAGQNSTLYVKKEIGLDDLSTIAVPGSVLAYSTPAGEHRSVVVATAEDGDDLAILINAAPSSYVLKDWAVLSADNTIFGNVGVFDVVNATLWNVLNENADSGSFTLYLQLTTTSHVFELVQGPTLPFGKAMFVLDSDRTTVTITFNLDVNNLIDFSANGATINITTEGQVEAGKSVEILGPDVYGYEPTGVGAIFKPYELDGGVIQGLFALPELGVLPYIVDTFDFPDGYNRTLEKWVELPPRLLPALHQIQNTHYTFLNLEPRTEGGLPRLTVVVRPRSNVNVTDVPVIEDVTNIISWKENAANLTPRAVVVRSHINYFEPTSAVETLGFYYDGVDDADPKVTGKPQGPRVVELEVNLSPSYTGGYFFGDGPAVLNDDKLKSVAKQFYEFYRGLSRPCEFVVYGTPTQDWVGNFISITEIDDPILETTFERNVFVTEVSVDPNTNTTTVKGRIGTYTNLDTSSPVVKIDGLLIWTDWDNSGDEEVILSAFQSYDPQGGPVTIGWYLGATLVETGPLLVRTFAVGEHDVTVRVTDENSNFTEEVITIIVTQQINIVASVDNVPGLNYATNGTFVPSKTAPTGTADTAGTLGEIRFDDSYIYLKTSAGWKRSALSTF